MSHLDIDVAHENTTAPRARLALTLVAAAVIATGFAAAIATLLT